MTKELATVDDRLPSLAPTAEVRDLLAGFSVADEGVKVVVNRKPTMTERQMLSKRGDEIERALTPVEASKQTFVVPNERGGTDQLNAFQYVGQLLALFFGNYPSMRGGDPRPTIAAYRKTLRGVPVFALERALEAIAEDRIRVSDGRGGEKPLDRNFAPAATQVWAVSRTFTDDLHAEGSKIIRVLRATVFERGEMDEAHRADIPRVRKMAADAKRALNWVDPEKEAALAAERARQEEERIRRHNERFFPPEKLSLVERLTGKLSPEGGDSPESTPMSPGGEATRPARKKKG
jgi:hypothetical protein